MNDLMKTPKMTPRIQSTLKHTVEVPEVMYKRKKPAMLVLD